MVRDVSTSPSQSGTIGATGLSKSAAVIKLFTFSPDDCFLNPVNHVQKAILTKPIQDVVRKLEELSLAKASKKGTLWLPTGSLVKSLILNEASLLMKQFGFSTLEIPTFFSVRDHAGIRELIARFRGELISVGGSEIEYFRYASDPILFPMYTGKIRETTRIYSPGLFWRNESGNATPLLRPREFNMTDFHSLVSRAESWREFCMLAALNKQSIDLWIPRNRYSLKVEISQEFFQEKRNELKQLLTDLGIDAVVRVLSQQTHYYSCQLQFVADVYGANWTQIGNLQLDHVNGGRFGIRDLSGESVDIIHGTHFGRVEKVLAAAVGIGFEEGPLTAILPLAISPVQVRLLALEGVTVEPYLVQKFAEHGIRFDLRSVAKGKLSQEIRQAARDWIPYLCVLGNSEVRNRTLSVRVRASGSIQDMSLNGFITEFMSATNSAF